MTAPTAPSPGSHTEPPGDGETGSIDRLDEARFEALYREYRPTLVRFAARRNADDPEAAADFALFGYYRARPRLESDDGDAVRSYLLTATANQVIDQHRRTMRSVAADQLDGENAGEPVPAFDDGVVDAALLHELIAALSPAQRDTILQRFYLDLTAEEAGRLQGREANAVHQLQHRAIGRLRKALLASLAAVLVLLVVWLARGVAPAQPVSTDPVGEPSTPTTVDEPGPQVGDADARTAADEEPPAPTTGPTTVDPAAPARPASVDRPLADQAGGSGAESSPTPTEPEAPQSTTSQPGTTGGPDQRTITAPSSTSTAPATTSPQPPTTATTAGAASPGFNRCVAFAVGADRLVITLYDPAGNAELAERYRAPARIRFVTDDGSTVFEIETDGQGIDGDTSGSAGWLDFGSGVRTHRRYADASPPTEWGVLLDNSVPDNWRRVDYTNPEGVWVAAPTCNV
ncbi:MAG: sigma-70 family RNA polymerase sigma factor [Actinomycetota bacterium]